MNKTLIIAEAGVNHNGDIELAKKLVDAAADAGADYVKFQTFKADKLTSKSAKQARYQIENIGVVESQNAMLKRLELTDEDHFVLLEHCKKRNIRFLSTAFDLESAEFLKDHIDLYKIPSGELTNLPYLEFVANLGLPTVMSTGMATLQEVVTATDILVANGLDKTKLTVLHCNTEYPTPMTDVNLSAMLTIKNELDVAVGYSDHTLGIEIPIAAVAMGARVIEKHFTLNTEMEGPDHKASLDPENLRQMVSSIRNIEMALGNGVKEPSPSESKNIHCARKSIVAKTDIAKGETLTAENLTIKRPGDGISPMKWYEILNTTSTRHYRKDDLI